MTSISRRSLAVVVLFAIWGCSEKAAEEPALKKLARPAVTERAGKVRHYHHHPVRGRQNQECLPSGPHHHRMPPSGRPPTFPVPARSSSERGPQDASRRALAWYDLGLLHDGRSSKTTGNLRGRFARSSEQGRGDSRRRAHSQSAPGSSTRCSCQCPGRGTGPTVQAWPRRTRRFDHPRRARAAPAGQRRRSRPGGLASGDDGFASQPDPAHRAA